MAVEGTSRESEGDVEFYQVCLKEKSGSRGTNSSSAMT